MFVFPMAGLSKRFQNAGYDLPKYRLQAGNKSVFAHVLSGFDFYFDKDSFLFICRDVAETPSFIETECAALGIRTFQIAVLNHPTRGQAETVYLGLKQAAIENGEPLAIFNIDTIHPHFRHPPHEALNAMDGYLEVFEGPGESWSFARTKSDTDMRVLETAEKRRISPYCSTGLYYFKEAEYFFDSYEEEASKPVDQWDASELYVAPLYNKLIRDGKNIQAVKIPFSTLIPCGIPEEYEAFCKSLSPSSSDTTTTVKF